MTEPAPGSVRFSVDVSKETYEEIRREAYENRCTKAEIVREALAEHFGNREGAKAADDGG